MYGKFAHDIIYGEKYFYCQIFVISVLVLGVAIETVLNLTFGVHKLHHKTSHSSA